MGDLRRSETAGNKKKVVPMRLQSARLLCCGDANVVTRRRLSTMGHLRWFGNDRKIGKTYEAWPRFGRGEVPQ